MFSKQSVHTAYYPKIVLPFPHNYLREMITESQLMDVLTQKFCIFNFLLSFSSRIFVASQQIPTSTLVLERHNRLVGVILT